MNTETIMLNATRTEIEVRPLTVLFGMGSESVPINYATRSVVLFGMTYQRQPLDFPPAHRFPEIRRNPTEQAELGSYFARLARDGVDQVIETTSVLLILRILRLVRDGVLSVDDVIMHHLSPKADLLTTLYVTDEGHLNQPTPDDFFTQDMREVFGETMTAEKVFGKGRVTS